CDRWCVTPAVLAGLVRIQWLSDGARRSCLGRRTVCLPRLYPVLGRWQIPGTGNRVSTPRWVHGVGRARLPHVALLLGREFGQWSRVFESEGAIADECLKFRDEPQQGQSLVDVGVTLADRLG